MNKILFLLLAPGIIACSCSSAKTHQHPPGGQEQGIEGYIYRISGNQMPSPGVKPPPPRGIKTFLYVYALTNIRQVQRQGQSAFYHAVSTKYITRIESDSDGYFKMQLAPGKYSLFAKKEELFYANWFDKDNNIAPVEVLPGRYSRVEFRIDYDAVY